MTTEHIASLVAYTSALIMAFGAGSTIAQRMWVEASHYIAVVALALVVAHLAWPVWCYTSKDCSRVAASEHVPLPFIVLRPEDRDVKRHP